MVIGHFLGPYQIVGKLGEGGMGEVYRARDARLQRDVAIKVLPDLFAADPERLARFEREAQVLALLNHPHIAAIYGLEESQDVGAGFSRPVRALILELVEGETLAERIAAGGSTRGGPKGPPLRTEGQRTERRRGGSSDPPIPLDEALSIARQIAEALEAAHEQGIIHRDLKPANIKVTPAGVVKVLDFGLAKLAEPGGSGRPAADRAQLSMSPTITSPAMMTGLGMILGTAAYMAPEQAKGKPADKRSDIWAFGCVLFEMLTGKRAFEGDDVSDTLAAVLRGEPDWNALPADAPPHLRAIVKSCLAKDRKARIPDISTVRFLMDGSGAFATPAVHADAGESRTRPASRVWQAVAALLALTTVAGAAAWWSASRSIAPLVTRFLVYPPEKSTFVTFSRTAFNPTASVAISPDGSKLAFSARDVSGKVLLWMRPIDSLAAQPLPGTDDAAYPFWSPDSRFIAYFARQKLLTIAASGGPPQTVCDTGLVGNRGGTWGPDGTIVFSTGPGRTLSRVASAGGQPSEFMRLAKGQTTYASRWFLPDGRHVLFYANATSDDAAGVYVGSLDAAESKRLAGADSAAVYDSHSGHLLFVRGGHADRSEVRP